MPKNERVHVLKAIRTTQTERSSKNLVGSGMVGHDRKRSCARGILSEGEADPGKARESLPILATGRMKKEELKRGERNWENKMPGNGLCLVPSGKGEVAAQGPYHGFGKIWTKRGRP